MLFINLALAVGLAGIAIPIILHLLNRRTARVVEWGAMRFLLESITSRRRRIQLEEALLMAARCLLVALLALALARPFVPPGSGVPWMIVLPAALLGVAFLGVTVALWQSRRWRLVFGGVAMGCLALAAAAVAFERRLNLDRFTGGERQDVAIIIDASTSMTLRQGGGPSAFERAVDEARQIVEAAGGGDAFSVILAGAVPSAGLPSPVSKRDEIRDALDAASPVGGAMAAYDALSYAGVVLSQGYNPNKQIILLTDGQRLGWNLDRPGLWESLREGLETLPSVPQLVVRQLPVPSSIRNAAISGVALSRQIVGTDRPVRIEVTVENPGTEAITPNAVAFRVGGEVVHQGTIGQMLPGEKSVVAFEHTFTQPGAVLAEAVLDVEDDVAADNSAPLAVQVQGELRVLMVDGNPVGSYFDRATAFAALALAPGFLETRRPAAGDGASAGADEAGGDEVRRFLVAPETVSGAELALLPSLSAYQVVVLADVPRLPPATARLLAQFVASGGGLLVAPGGRAEPEFYNRWTSAEGEPVLPVSLRRFEPVAGDPEAGQVQVSSISHPALRLLADPATSDLSTAVVRSRWTVDEPAGAEANVSVGARLRDGSVLLAERRLGAGSVVLAASSLDNRAGNLATRQAFVPLVHELVYHLSNPGGIGLNLDPAAGLSLNLSATGGGSRAVAGLLGRYFADREFRQPVLARVDPTVDFRWEDASPGGNVATDNFSVRWTGTLRPRFSETYEFSCEADDDLSLWIDDRPVIRSRSGGSIDLVAGRSHAIRVEHVEYNGHASARLYWKSPSEPWGVVPPSVLVPFAPDESGEGDSVGRFAVTAPDGGTRQAEIVFTRQGLSARVDGAALPGAYRLEIPEEKREGYRFLLGDRGTAIPFTVRSDPGEATMTTLSPADFDFIGRHMDVLQPDSVEEVARILEGREFGRELWRMLAVGALILLLAELLLSRWIARSRAVDEAGKVDFEGRNQPRAEFRQALDRLRGSGGAKAGA